MKTTDLNLYEAPLLELVELNLEQSFANSIQPAGSENYGEF